MDGMTGDGGVDDPVLGTACTDREIEFFHLPFAKELNELLMGSKGFRCDQDAGGIFVQAVDDPGAEGVGTWGDFIAVGEEGVDKGSCPMSGGGVGHHAGRFVNGQKMFVFINDFEGDCFREQRRKGLRKGLETDFDFISLFRDSPLFNGLPIEKDAAAFNQVLEISSGVARIAPGQELIDTNSLFLSSYEEKFRVVIQ
jgi:hypothetical protein